MTADERKLLLTVARTLRDQISERIASGNALRCDRIDHACLNEAIKPFDPTPSDPVNEDKSK